MENLESRIEKLEKKYRFLRNSVVVLSCFAVCAGLSGITSISPYAAAQERNAKKGGDNSMTRDEKERKEAGIPSVIEAEIFLLKDADGKVRGVWSADNDTTSFAMMHKDKLPVAAISVDNKNATMSLTDVYSGKISLSLANSVRSLSITDDSKKNNVYMGLTGAGDANIDLISTGSAGIAIDGNTSSIDMTGDRAVIALAETVGSTVALKAQPSASSLTFLDHQGDITLDATTIDGKTEIMLKSPATKDEKRIKTTPEEVLALNAAIEKDAKSEEADAPEVKKDDFPVQKDEKKLIDMKNYSPFAK